MSLPAPRTEPQRQSRHGRVLHVITRLDRGGSADNTLVSCLGLDALGWEVMLVHGPSVDPSPVLERVRRRDTIAVIEIPELIRSVEPICDMKAYGALRRLMLCSDFDVVHTHSSKAGLLGRAAAHGLHCRVVHTPHGHVFGGYFSRLVSGVFVWLERLAAHWCDRIVTLTDRGREEHLSHGVGHANQFVTIPSGINLEAYRNLPPRRAAREALGLPLQAPVVCCVARLTGIKGQRYLLDALARLPESLDDVHLVLTGDGEDRKRLESRARQLGVDQRVTFTGALDNPHRTLAAAELFVMPSLNEGQGRAVVEAMAAGLPVIASDVGGLPEVLDRGRAGVLVPPADADALAMSVERLLRTPHEAARLAAAGRERATHYSEATMIEQLDRLYRGMLLAGPR